MESLGNSTSKPLKKYKSTESAFAVIMRMHFPYYISCMSGNLAAARRFYLKQPRASEKLSPYVCHVKAWSAFLKPLIKKASDYERCKAFHAIIRMSENAHDSTCFSICKRTRKNTHGLYFSLFQILEIQ